VKTVHIRSEEGVHKNTKADARINESTPQIPAKRNVKFHTISEHEKKKKAPKEGVDTVHGHGGFI
jgi:hypothetical protein